MLITVAFALMLFVLLAVFVMQRGRRAGGGGMLGSMGNTGVFVQGMLTVTGVSDRPDAGDRDDQMFCTVSGTIIGPDTAPTDVYGNLVLTGKTPWPQIGADMAVVYKPGKAETSWRFGNLDTPPAL